MKMQLVTVLALLLCAVHVHGEHGVAEGFTEPGFPDICLAGPYHKETPSREGAAFSECLSWQNLSCCNVATSETIDLQNAVGLYNFSWDVCNAVQPLSAGCEEFIKDEECFYQCEPMLGYFETMPGSGVIAGVPVCADYCNRWFDACRNDYTCVENWLGDFNLDENGTNSCPANSPCVTFEAMYGNGEGLCNRMWGSAFVYSPHTYNCTVMAFDRSMPNPNTQLTFPSAGASALTPAILVLTLSAVVAAFKL